MATGLVALLATPLWFAGYRINETESLPPGIWRITGQQGTAARGQIVSFCPPQIAAITIARARGYLRDGPCPGGHEPMFKPVVAVAGDVVSITGAGVAVNGALIPNSVPMATDGGGRPMPRLEPGDQRVASGQIWVVSSYNPLSFDSRYFGPIAEASVDGQAEPIWIRGVLP